MNNNGHSSQNLRIAHDRFGGSSDLNLNGHLHYPNDIDRSLNETADDKMRKHRADYNNNPSNATSFMMGYYYSTVSTSVMIITHLTLLRLVRLGGYIVNLCDFYSYRPMRTLTAFLQLQE
jgi:hypothetical protein